MPAAFTRTTSLSRKRRASPSSTPNALSADSFKNMAVDSTSKAARLIISTPPQPPSLPRRRPGEESPSMPLIHADKSTPPPRVDNAYFCPNEGRQRKNYPSPRQTPRLLTEMIVVDLPPPKPNIRFKVSALGGCLLHGWRCESGVAGRCSSEKPWGCTMTLIMLDHRCAYFGVCTGHLFEATPNMHAAWMTCGLTSGYSQLVTSSPHSLSLDRYVVDCPRPTFSPC